ncbi:MAG: hypothetical protein ACI81T_004604, partial [Bacteroidia bacterium]
MGESKNPVFKPVHLIVGNIVLLGFHIHVLMWKKLWKVENEHLIFNQQVDGVF